MNLGKRKQEQREKKGNYKTRTKNIDINQLKRLGEKYKFVVSGKEFKHNQPLFAIVNHDKKISTIYFFIKYHKQEFNLKYSCNNKVKKGVELIMSSLPMPDINKFIK